MLPLDLIPTYPAEYQVFKILVDWAGMYVELKLYYNNQTLSTDALIKVYLNQKLQKDIYTSNGGKVADAPVSWYIKIPSIGLTGHNFDEDLAFFLKRVYKELVVAGFPLPGKATDQVAKILQGQQHLYEVATYNMPYINKYFTKEEITLTLEKLNAAKKYSAPAVDTVSLSILSEKLPGVKELVRYPCAHGKSSSTMSSVWSTVQHLNDIDKWTREEIADWLDMLHDSGQINIEFNAEGGEE